MRIFRRSGRRNGSKTTASNLRVAQPRPQMPAFDSVPLPFAFDACQFITTTSANRVNYAPSCAQGAYWCILALVLAQLTSGWGASTVSTPPSRFLYVNTTFDSTLGFPGKSLSFVSSPACISSTHKTGEKKEILGIWRKRSLYLSNTHKVGR